MKTEAETMEFLESQIPLFKEHKVFLVEHYGVLEYEANLLLRTKHIEEMLGLCKKEGMPDINIEDVVCRFMNEAETQYRAGRCGHMDYAADIQMSMIAGAKLRGFEI